MDISLFNMVLLYGDAPLALFNESLHPFQKEAFLFTHEAISTPLGCLGTQCAQALQNLKSSCTMACLDP